MTSQIDALELARQVKARRGTKGLRAVASEIGVSFSTLSRVEQGKLPDLDTYMRLCEWLELPADALRNETFSNTGEKSNQEKISIHLRTDKTLDPATAKALVQMIDLAYSTSKQDTDDKNGEDATRIQGES